MPSQLPSPSVTSNSELQSLDNEQNNLSTSNYHHNNNHNHNHNQHHHQNRNHHHHHHHYQHNNNNNSLMNDSNQQHTSKTNLYIKGLSEETTDNDLHEMCKRYA